MARIKHYGWKIAYADRRGTIEYAFSPVSRLFTFARFATDGTQLATGESAKSFSQAAKNLNRLGR